MGPYGQHAPPWRCQRTIYALRQARTGGHPLNELQEVEEPEGFRVKFFTRLRDAWMVLRGFAKADPISGWRRLRDGTWQRYRAKREDLG